MYAKTEDDVKRIVNDIIAHGYKEFRPGPFDHGERAFQKRFRDEAGNTKYFVTIYMYAPIAHQHTGEIWGPAFEMYVQTYGVKAHDAIDMTFHSSWGLDEAEAFMEELFKTGMLDHYEKDGERPC